MWRKWVKYHQWQTVTTNPPVNKSTTLSLTEQSIALPLNMFTYLFKLAELRGELKQLNPHACMGSYLSWIWGTQSHRWLVRNQLTAVSMPTVLLGHWVHLPPLLLWEHCIFLHLFARTHSSSGSPSEKSLPSLPHLLRVLSARPRQDLKHMRLRALLSGGWELSLNFTSRSIGWHQDSRRLLLWEHTYVSMSLH